MRFVQEYDHSCPNGLILIDQCLTISQSSTSLSQRERLLKEDGANNPYPFFLFRKRKKHVM